jgi:nitrous oxide reductase accessory protein NosL
MRTQIATMLKTTIITTACACILSAGIALLVLGCGSQPQKSAHKRFQSVAPEEAVLLQTGEEKADCPVCGMHLPTFYKTSHAVTFQNKQLFQFCSLHCLVDALEHHLDPETREQIILIQAVDAQTNALIDAQKAFYVVGSKKPATMSRVSKYAFKTRAAAEAFAEMYGGKIMDFAGAYARAKEDFK